MNRIFVTAFLVLGTLGLVVLANSVYTVSQVQQALVVRLGSPNRVETEPGLKFKIPLAEEVIYFDNRLLEFNAASKQVIASDQKRLVVDAFVRYRITDPLRFYQAVREEAGMQRQLDPIVDSSLRKVLGSVPLRVILSDERAQLMRDIREEVNAKATGQARKEEAAAEEETPVREHAIQEPQEQPAETVEAQAETPAPATEAEEKIRGYEGFGVEIVDVRIMRTDLPEGNSQAIFQRMQAGYERQAKEARAKGEEEAQRIRSNAERERTVLLANAEREAQILRGQGDAEATRIFADAFNRDPEFFEFYRSMQAYRKILKKEDTTLVLSPNSDLLRYFEDLEKGRRGN